MTSFEHKEVIKRIKSLDEVPDDKEIFGRWIKAGSHLQFLQQNARTDEIIVYASGEFTFIHSAVVSNEKLSPTDEADLLHWHGTPYNPIAGYVSGGGRDPMLQLEGVCKILSLAFEV